MKKMMLLFAVAAMVMAACGGNQAQGGEDSQSCRGEEYVEKPDH